MCLSAGDRGAWVSLKTGHFSLLAEQNPAGPLGSRGWAGPVLLEALQPPAVGRVRLLLEIKAGELCPLGKFALEWLSDPEIFS